MYKLTIIIPTYNGGGWIEDTINSVLYQLKGKRDQVELFVRDNASTDDTPSVIDRLNKGNEGVIHYDRRETNVDADVNFKEAVSMTSSDYVLLLGDDDLLFPNFIKYTLELIERYPGIGLIYYNRICTSRDYNGAKLKHLNPNSTFERFYENTEDFIKDHITGPDFMSVNVVKRECLEKGITQPTDRYYGVKWYYSLLYGLKGHQCLSLFTPMILQRVPSVRMWSNKVLLYVAIGMDNLFEDLSKIYPNVYRAWQDYSDNNVPTMNFILSSITANRKLYKEKWGELSTKLGTFEREVAKVLIFYPVSTPVVKLFCRVLLKFKIIKG